MECLNQSALVAATFGLPERSTESAGEAAVQSEFAAGAGDELTELVATVNPLLVTVFAGARSSFDGRGRTTSGTSRHPNASCSGTCCGASHPTRASGKGEADSTGTAALHHL